MRTIGHAPTRTRAAASVDDTISAVPGEWRFSEDVSRAFDAHVRKSVPFYDEIQRMVTDLSEYFIRDGSICYDLGSSTGETLARLADAHAGKQDVHLTGFDLSESMVREARAKVRAPSVRFVQADIAEVELARPASFVTSLFTLQFLTLDQRVRLLSRVHDAAALGAALILVEKVRAESAFFEDVWLDLHWDFKRRQGLSAAQILEKAASLRGVLNPLSAEENVAQLRASGFGRVETFFRWFNWAGFIAVKTA